MGQWSPFSGPLEGGPRGPRQLRQKRSAVEGLEETDQGGLFRVGEAQRGQDGLLMVIELHRPLESRVEADHVGEGLESASCM